jgi:pilus assembly protein CpaD
MFFNLQTISGARTAVMLAARGLAIAGLAAVLAGCNTTTASVEPEIPRDYRLRHPIAIKEGTRSLELFVGSGRGGLTPVQRAEVLAFAQTWKREGTGGLTIDRPVGVPNERAALDTIRQVLSILVAAGIPNHGIGIQPYQPAPSQLATIRINHPRMVADAGPCGLWPDDLGPSTDFKEHFSNAPYYNLGCAHQRNLAAMVDNPADLVQPRGETPIYTAKRSFGTDKWRRGESPATVYPDTQKGAISDLGK